MKVSQSTEPILPGFSRVSIGKAFIGVGISAVFVALALRGIDLVQVGAHFRQMDAGMLPLIFVCLVVVFILKTARWQYLISPVKHIAFGRMFTTTLIGFMANNAMPLRSGDLLRAHLLGRQENIGTTAVFATVAVDRMFEVLSLLTVSILVLVMIPLPGWMWHSVIVLGVALLGVAAGIVAFHRPPRLIEKWWRVVHRLPSERVQEILSTFIKEVRLGLGAARGKGRLSNIYILAIGESAVSGILTYWSLSTVGIQLPIVAIMSIMIACNLAVAIPAVPGNIGVFEFAVMTTLQLFQVDRDVALSGAVILHIIQVIPASLVGLVFFMGTWLRLKGAPN